MGTPARGRGLVQKDKPLKYTDKIDSLDLEFDWKKELFRQWDCYCPWLTPDVVRSMPRELHPYKWVNENKPIIVDDSTFRQLIKSDLAFKKMYQQADSLRKEQDSIRILKNQP